MASAIFLNARDPEPFEVRFIAELFHEVLMELLKPRATNPHRYVCDSLIGADLSEIFRFRLVAFDDLHGKRAILRLVLAISDAVLRESENCFVEAPTRRDYFLVIAIRFADFDSSFAEKAARKNRKPEETI